MSTRKRTETKRPPVAAAAVGCPIPDDDDDDSDSDDCDDCGPDDGPTGPPADCDADAVCDRLGAIEAALAAIATATAGFLPGPDTPPEDSACLAAGRFSKDAKVDEVPSNCRVAVVPDESTSCVIGDEQVEAGFTLENGVFTNDSDAPLRLVASVDLLVRLGFGGAPASERPVVVRAVVTTDGDDANRIVIPTTQTAENGGVHLTGSLTLVVPAGASVYVELKVPPRTRRVVFRAGSRIQFTRVLLQRTEAKQAAKPVGPATPARAPKTQARAPKAAPKTAAAAPAPRVVKAAVAGCPCAGGGGNGTR